MIVSLYAYIGMFSKEILVAAGKGDIQTIKCALIAGTLDLGSEGPTNPLVMAAAYDRFEVVELLLSVGADIDAKDKARYLLPYCYKSSLLNLRVLLPRSLAIPPS